MVQKVILGSGVSLIISAWCVVDCKEDVLEAMAAEDVKQSHLFLLYDNMVPSVTDYALGLTTLSQTNLP